MPILPLVFALIGLLVADGMGSCARAGRLGPRC